MQGAKGGGGDEDEDDEFANATSYTVSDGDLIEPIDSDGQKKEDDEEEDEDLVKILGGTLFIITTDK